ncbi:anti-sigma factor [Aeromicrobium sp. NPDC092404]|uniref:anti-sigma factor n=1 Tax=Aeromicrobium sp. NPDC092404 TaxID=3154976 RepID=UPI003419A93C
MTTDLHSLLAPYVLDALDAEERNRFEAHLSQCPDCSAELGGLQATATRLAEAQSQTPPAELRQRLVAAVSSVPQERPIVTALSGRGGTLRRRVPQLVAAAALVVGVAGAGGYLVEHDRAAERSEKIAAMTRVLGAPDADTKALSFPDGGTVRLVTSESRDAAVVVADELPDLDDGKVYQVWLIDGAKAQSQGTFSRSGDMIMEDLTKVDKVAVTVEPSGGSEKPTTDPIVDVPI